MTQFMMVYKGEATDMADMSEEEGAAVMAVTTVGFGDLVPTTDAAKLFTVAYVIAGISVLGLFLNERLRRSQYRRRVKKKRRHEGRDDD